MSQIHARVCATPLIRAEIQAYTTCAHRNNDLHVWHVDLDDPQLRIDDCVEALDASERARADQFAFAELRRRYVAAHAALRAILGLALNRSPAGIKLRTDSNGKPCLVNPDLPIRFNLSHSADRALVAVSWCNEVGVDLERWSPPSHLLAMVDCYFSALEKDAFWTLGNDEQLQSLHRWWTLKEACLKATGEGLRVPLNSFSVEFRPKFPPRLLDGPSTMQSLQLKVLDITDTGWSAALAWMQPAGDTEPSLVVRQWSWQGWKI